MKSEEAQIKGPRLEKPVRITEQVWPEGITPVVSILCHTYQHVNFIRDAVEGFLMQETTFPVEIIIRDDASTDGTAEIVREYQEKFPQIIRTILHSKNQYSQGKKAFPETYAIARGDFTALCEGDDYWICKEKLQKQVDILENDETIAGCCHESLSEVNGKKQFEAKKYWGIYNSQLLNLNTLLCSNPIGTQTSIFRARYAADLPKNFLKYAMLDWPLWIWVAMKGPFFFDQEPMAFYRRHSNGIWSSKDNGCKQFEILKMLCGVSRYVSKDRKSDSINGIAKFYFPFILKSFFEGDSEYFLSGKNLVDNCSINKKMISSYLYEHINKNCTFGICSSKFKSFKSCYILVSELKCVLKTNDKSQRLLKQVSRSIIGQAFTEKLKKPFFSIFLFFVALQLSIIGTISATCEISKNWFFKEFHG
jgi:glycosyltransferase involved in cell wall biosynthesis